MIIERYTFPVKVGYRDEFVELIKASIAESGLTPRVYTYIVGPHDVVISDAVFETEEERLKYWEEIDWSKPKAAEFQKKYADLAENGATNVLLRVH